MAFIQKILKEGLKGVNSTNFVSFSAFYYLVLFSGPLCVCLKILLINAISRKNMVALNITFSAGVFRYKLFDFLNYFTV